MTDTALPARMTQKLTWNPATDYYLVVPAKDGLVRVLTVRGQYKVTQEGKLRLGGHVLAEHDMTIEAARDYTMVLPLIDP